MKASSLHELQKELQSLPVKRITDVAIRLAKHKKENKELLTYLLFESDDEEQFISDIKKEIDQQFAEMNSSNLYYAKKTLRKILRLMNKHIKYSGIKKTEVELRLYYCNALKNSGIKYHKSQVLLNLYNGQLKKIAAAFEKLHEDVQLDYRKEVESVGLKIEK